MKLDRNTNPDQKAKYAVINLRKIAGNPRTAEDLAAAILANPESVEFGAVGSPDEFFVVKLKDRFAPGALFGYANAAEAVDVDYSMEVRGLGLRAGENHPNCKTPD